MGIRTKKIKIRKAVFLDRDGTIISQVELLHKSSELKLIPGAAKAINIFNCLGYFVVIVSNQPVVARGIIEFEEAGRIFDILVKRLGRMGAKIDAVYFCPHHPDAYVKKYKLFCKCRKPAPGMILDAATKYGINLKQSFFIGDSTQDVLAANKAKIKMILVKTGHGGKDSWQHKGSPDFTVKNILEASEIIKNFKIND